MEDKLKTFFLGVIYIILFEITQIFLTMLFEPIAKSYSDIISILFIGVIYIIIKRKDILEDFKNFKKSNFKLNILLFLIMFIIVTICSKIFPKIFNIMITNERVIEENIAIMPIKTFISACILAPLYEEILVRKNFKNAFKNKWLFVTITGILFASLHILTIQSLIELIYFPLYIIMGITLSYIYYNDNNIISSILCHMLNNILSFIIILIF